MSRITRNAVAFGATVVFSLGAAATASATTINGSGASLQTVAQQQLWAPSFSTFTSGADSIVYSPTNSGAALAEFGNTGAGLGVAGGVDDYVGTDDAPSAAQATVARTATGNNAREITVPVAQAPVAIIGSLPAGLTISNTRVALSQALLEQVYHQDVAAAGGYAADTWGALLSSAGATITGDSGGAGLGGNKAITLQVRLGGSGTTRAVKGFLEQIDTGDTHGWNHDGSDDWSNTSGTSSTGNSGGSGLVTSTLSNPGSIGYANLADTTASVTNLPVAVTTGGSASHQVIRFQLRNGAGTARDASSNPASQTTAAGNLTTGAGAGSWTSLPGSVTSTTTWENTIASTTSTAAGVLYPLAAPTYDLGWDNYAAVRNGVGGSLVYTVPAEITTANDYFDYLVGAGEGQPTVDARGYNRLPDSVQSLAATAAGLVN